jgi:hypothetical protein
MTTPKKIKAININYPTERTIHSVCACHQEGLFSPGSNLMENSSASRQAGNFSR